MTDAAPRHLLILGSTGSIGRQALEVLPAVPGLRLVGLAAGRGAAGVVEQARAHGVREVCLHDAGAAAEAAALAPELAVLAGEAGIRELIAGAAERAAAEGAPLTVLNGVVGAAGLRATMATLEAGATLALANKESMVAGGPFVLDAARRSGSLILPVDSEHSALFQCIAAGGPQGGGGEAGADVVSAGPPRALEELLLTGSGGPFRGRTAAELAAVTPEQALAHPNWSMGPKITIDSATLMNKGLELIEAHYLFGVPYEHITVVLDPQSTVHSMARFSDGAILAHLGVPDMRTPIGYALAYPERPALPQVRRLDLFATPDRLRAARHGDVPLPGAGRGGGDEGDARGARGGGRRRGPAHGRRPDRAQRRQRGRRRGVPRRAGSRSSASPRSSRSASTGSATSRGRVARRRLRVRRRGAALRRRGRGGRA